MSDCLRCRLRNRDICRSKGYQEDKLILKNWFRCRSEAPELIVQSNHSPCSAVGLNGGVTGIFLVLSHCQVWRLPAVLYLCYTDVMKLDLLTAAAFQPVLASRSLKGLAKVSSGHWTRRPSQPHPTPCGQVVRCSRSFWSTFSRRW